MTATSHHGHETQEDQHRQGRLDASNAASMSRQLDTDTASPDEHDWDAIYSDGGTSPMWSGRPNGSLVVEVESLAPATVLDVGAGEGGDAVWLARNGWEVTAVEPSGVALDRGRAAADREGVDVSWHHAVLLDMPPDLGPFDLVSAQYPALRATPDARHVRALLDAVAPGGTLLVVHHHLDGHGFGGNDVPEGPDDVHDGGDEHHDGPSHDPADYVMPADVAAHLAASVHVGDWEVELHEVRPRPGELPPDARHVEDVVLRVRRRA